MTSDDAPAGAVPDALRRLLDRQEIHDLLCRYARGCDRGDWELVRSAYHPDAEDDHVSFRGGVDDLIVWLTARFADVDNSVHFLGNQLVEPTGPDTAFVETYFISSRVVSGSRLRQSWGRYLDHVERRDGEWRIARRRVVLETSFTTDVSPCPPTTHPAPRASR